MASPTDSKKPRTFNPTSVPPPPPTFEHVAVTPILPSSRLVTLAGQVGTDAATGHLPSDFIEQVKFAYANVAKCLEASGASPRDIVHVRHYIVRETGNTELDSKDIVDRGWGPLWMEFMDAEADGHRPPDTVLGVASLAKRALLYEVEAWAITHA